MLLTKESGETEDSIRSTLSGIDLSEVRFMELASLGLQNFKELDKTMSPISDIENLRCIPLRDAICNTSKALKEARSQI